LRGHGLNDGDTSLGVLGKSLVSIDATLSPKPEEPHRLDE
jgi:hypothetical protein